MRIDNWPLDRIMRLPDWCFGRRWWIGEFLVHATGDVNRAIGTESLPDKFVVWGVLFSCISPSCLQALEATIRLGDHGPVDDADAMTMERLLKGINVPGFLYEFFVEPNGTTWINCEREIVESAGRRLVFVSLGDGAIDYQMTAAILISALPKEVPDWLISGQAANLL